jgi:hypothetical protein
LEKGYFTGGLDSHIKEDSGKESFSHWELCEGIWREEFFSWESKNCVKKVLVRVIFLLKGPVFGERMASLSWALRER